MGGEMDVWVSEWMDGWVDGWMGGWLDGWVVGWWMLGRWYMADGYHHYPMASPRAASVPSSSHSSLPRLSLHVPENLLISREAIRWSLLVLGQPNTFPPFCHPASS